MRARTVDLEEAGEAAGGEVAVEAAVGGEVEEAAVLLLPVPPRAVHRRREVSRIRASSHAAAGTGGVGKVGRWKWRERTGAAARSVTLSSPGSVRNGEVSWAVRVVGRVGR